VAKEKWKCPYLRCRQDSSRRSNMVRHIKRFYGGLGSPAKEKPSAIDSSILNNSVDSGVPSSLPGKLRPNASQVKEKDIVDMYYDWFSKIKEMQAFFGQSGSPILTLPGSFPVSFLDY
jgi:hypothetical protein